MGKITELPKLTGGPYLGSLAFKGINFESSINSPGIPSEEDAYGCEKSQHCNFTIQICQNQAGHILDWRNHQQIE